MKLRKYKKDDSAIICSWIKYEMSLYQWSAEYKMAIGEWECIEMELLLV